MGFPSTRSALATIFHTRHSMTGSRRHRKRLYIPYTAFYDWFKKTQKKVVPVEVEGIPEELLQSDNTHEDVTEDKPKRTTPHKGSIMVTIRTREGLCIQKKDLDYQGLKTLVEKLEGLC